MRTSNTESLKHSGTSHNTESLMVHQMQWPSSWEHMGTRVQRLVFSVVPSFSVERLRDEGGFKAEVLADLTASGQENWPLTLVLRQYVESLTSINEALRNMVSGQVKTDDDLLKHALDRARTEVGPELAGLGLTETDDEGRVREHHYLTDNPLKRRATLLNKNKIFGNLSRRYVAAERPRRLL